MNNKYDRGAEMTDVIPTNASPNYDEMIAAGYTMTADGFWIKEDGEIEMDIDETEPNVKILLLQSGEQLVADVGECLSSDTILLKDPRGVVLQSTSSDGQEISSTISYGIWFPLSESREIAISLNYIVAMEDPIQSLKQSYLSQTVEVAD